jgi:hypothetical protein
VARSLQSPAHLVDRLPRANAEPAREFVVIQRAAGPPQLFPDARGDGQACHGQIISPAAPCEKARTHP